MSYTALYRKFRPAGFEDVKGQDHIVRTLKNQIKANRIGHAYLFCGTRGTGKTSVAKILAKTVNCANPKDGEACGECASCKAIAAGVSMNVIEIDAASNNGVDNIREIRDEVEYSPTEGKYKVYIIDEVHMLSIGAFNALLKTLEEPPGYVIFILATTEAHKIPITILSRCQRYDFKRISIDTIADRLTQLMQEEHIEIEDKAIRYIAKKADGSLRDALSLLEQCISFYMNQKITYDHVLEVLGAVDTEVFAGLLRMVTAMDTLGTIRKLDELVNDGRDLSQFVADFVWYMRNLLLVKTMDNPYEIIEASTENIKSLEADASMLDEDVLIRYIRIFSELSNQIRYSTQKRILIEIAMLKLTVPAMEKDYESIINRLMVVEKKLEEGTFATKQVIVKEANEPKKTVKRKAISAMSADAKDVKSKWREIVEAVDNSIVKNGLKGSVVGEKPENTGGRLVIDVKSNSLVDYCSREEKESIIPDAIEKIIGKRFEIELNYMSDDEEYEEVEVPKDDPVYLKIQKENDTNIDNEQGGFFNG
ncbi:MAG: DNA polymerase III subunit gamma/tau [Lachnospira sp.]|nr:DNA polymerase III subunit gamma/tau [Lachnospira sp.]